MGTAVRGCPAFGALRQGRERGSAASSRLGGGGFSVVEVGKREALVVSSSLPGHLTSEKIHKLENL